MTVLVGSGVNDREAESDREALPEGEKLGEPDRVADAVGSVVVVRVGVRDCDNEVVSSIVGVSLGLRV